MTARLLTPMALRGWRLAWWVATFGVGAYAGYKIAFYSGDSSGWGMVGVLLVGAFWVAATAVPVAILALVAAFLYRASFKGRLPAASAVMIGAILYVAGVAVGIVMTPVLGLEYRYREPVVLVGRGTMTLSLDGVAGYVARTDAPAMCGSVQDGEGVSSVSATAIGTIDGVDVDATVVGIDLDAPSVGVGGIPTVVSKSVGWSGPVDFVDRTQGGREGHVTFVGAVLDNNGTGGPAQGTWPATLSGTLTWSCGDWIGPATTPGPGPAETQPLANSAAPPSGWLPSPTASPTAAVASGHWPYETTGQISDVLFAPDGRVVVVEGNLGAETSRVVTLTADGAIVDGWPWAPPPTGDFAAVAALGPDGTVYVAVRGLHGSPAMWSWTLHRLDRTGAEVTGFPVPLPSVPFCSLQVSDGVAYVLCELVAEGTGATISSVVAAIRPDGSTAPGWPVQLAAPARLTGFGADGAVFIGSGDEQRASITAFDRNGATLRGWPQAARPFNGDAGVDRQGRVWYSSYDWTEGQCGPAALTVYTALNREGQVPSGWPVSVTGWASGPAIASDGVMYVAQQGRLANAHAPTGSVVPGWPAKNVDVAVGCYAGSRPFLAGNDGVVILGDHEVTLIQRDGVITPGWPVELPYKAAINCPTCTPGLGVPVDPAVGEQGVWIAAYDGDFYADNPRPRLIGIDRTGSLPPAWQQAFGRAGDEILWLRVAPAGGVWAAVVSDLGGDQTRSSLYRVADDRPVGD